MLKEDYLWGINGIGKGKGGEKMIEACFICIYIYMHTHTHTYIYIYEDNIMKPIKHCLKNEEKRAWR
jgi:hypothetical protein